MLVWAGNSKFYIYSLLSFNHVIFFLFVILSIIVKCMQLDKAVFTTQSCILISTQISYSIWKPRLMDINKSMMLYVPGQCNIMCTGTHMCVYIMDRYLNGTDKPKGIPLWMK